MPSDSPISLSSLPLDAQERFVVSVGPVSRIGPGSTEPRWQVGFKTRGAASDLPSGQSYVAIPVAAGVLYNVPIGSMWRGNTSQNLYGPWPAQKIKIDASNQRIVWRQGHNPVSIQETPTRGALPCIDIPLVGHPLYKSAIVRCSEIVRFFFGGLPVLVRHIFDFSNGVKVNDHLFVSNQTRISADQVVIRPTRKLSNDAQAALVAGFLGHEPSARSLGCIASSARKAHQNNEPVFPQALIPIDGIAEWNVLGVEHPVYELDETGIVDRRLALMVANIQTSWDEVRWPEVSVLSDTKGPKPPTDRNTRIISSAETVRDDHTITSTELAGSHASVDSEAFEMMFGARPNMRQPKPTIRHQQAQLEDRESIRVAGTAEQLNEVSALGGGSGSPHIGSIAPGSSLVAADHEYEGEEPEPIDRSSLPSIFEDVGLVLPTKAETDWTQVPNEFFPFVHAGAQLKDHLPNLSSVDFVGQPASEAMETLNLLQLPPEWGRKVVCKDSPTQLRRALVMRLVFENAGILILSLERRASEVGRMGPCSFISSETLPPAFIANALKWRLDSSAGWPSRSTHDGNFHSRRLKHAQATRSEIPKTVNKIIETVSVLSYRTGHPRS